MTRDEAVARVVLLIEQYQRLLAEPNQGAVGEFVRALFSTETDIARNHLAGHTGLDHPGEGREVLLDDLDLEVITAFGWLQFMRAEVLPEESGGAERGLAMYFLFLTYQSDPASVPHMTLRTFIEASPDLALDHGSRKLDHYHRTSDPESLFLAVDLLEGAAAVPTDPADLDREELLHHLVAAHSALSFHHLMAYMQIREAEQLEGAIAAARLAVANSPAEDWPTLADQLSDCLRVKAEADGDVEAIEEAVTLSREAIAAAATGGRIDPRFLSRLSVALRVADGLSPDIKRLDEAVHYGRQAVGQTQADDVNWPARVGNLASALTQRFRVTARTKDIDEAIELHTLAAARQRPEDPDPGMAYSNLCEALRLRFLPTTDATGHERAVEAARRAVAVTPAQHVHYGMYCGNLAVALTALMDLTGDENHVEEAVRMARTAFAVTPPGHPEHHTRLGGLLGVLRKSYRAGDIGALDECLTLSRRGLADLSPSHPAYPSVLANHAGLLVECHRLTDSPDLLTEAVDSLRKAGEAVTPDRFGKARILRALVNSWKEAIAVGEASPDDLARLIPVIREVLKTAEPTSAEHSELLVALVDGLTFLVQLDPRPDLLDEAVAAASELTRSGTDHHVHVTEYLIAISEPFLRLFETYSDHTALDEAIRALRRAHELLGGLDQSRADVAHRLCVMLIAAKGFRGPTALTDAIRFARQAVELLPPGSPRQLNARTALSSALQDHAIMTGNMRHLRESLEISRALVEQTPEGTDELDSYRFDLALGLQILADREGEPQHLDEAIRIFRALAADRAVDDVKRSRRLFHLGRLHLDRYRATANAADHRAAIAAFAEAARLPNASPLQRLTAARSSGQLNHERRDWAAATSDYALAVDQLPFAVGPRLTDEARETMLSDTTGIAIAAASCALESGDPLRAVQLLEAGRATLITQALDLRGLLSAVREHAPHLAAQWQQLWGASAASADETLTRRHRRAAWWNGLRKDLLALPGVERLLAQPSRQALTDAAADGPLVVINSYGSRTDAIVITENDVDALRLPLSEEDAAHAVNTLLRMESDVNIKDRAAGKLFEILEWLWDCTAQPVLRTLGMGNPHSPAEAPRLWWCPTGVFTFLPLAAAGHHGTTDTVLDHVVSSFTPTIRALVHARSRRPARTDTFLGVAVPDARGWPSLPGVKRETEFLRGIFPDGVFLADTDAARHQVLTQLTDADRVHFACHGVTDPYRPSSSRLILHSGAELRVGDISQLELNADLAFLSACSTAQGGYTLPDEAITIASAFLLAGYRNAVATLWPIYDTEAPRTTQDFYQALTSTTEPARALHQALHRARTRNPDRPDTWSSYVHYGA
ncbi:CHAT domain-containing protein [Saccharothrix deserti]|uniref:CHAT domain-containing protein n=1 Tax=Saccharothrix deserti TaxID=2593674 RepID=UPI00131D73AA|nr:CHAT domain-containing protein [Saccharothrix deserti]